MWEQNSGVLVMLTRSVEAGVLKCSEYFPSIAGASKAYGESSPKASHPGGADA